MGSILKIKDRIDNIMLSFNSAFPNIKYYIGSDYESINYSTNYIVFSFNGGSFAASSQNRLDLTVNEDGYKKSYKFLGSRNETIIADLWFDTYENTEIVLTGLLAAIKIVETVNVSNISWVYISETEGSTTREGQHIQLSFDILLNIPSMTFYLKDGLNINTTYKIGYEDVLDGYVVNPNLYTPDKFAINKENINISSPSNE